VLSFRLSTFPDLYLVCVCVFSCTVLFVSISQVIGCEDRLRNDLAVSGGALNSTPSIQHRDALNNSEAPFSLIGSGNNS